ncbi:GNAT family N-acetyltransferase [Paenibacillus sp. MBLB4367]|uniref:GNAT family N-acetyltransferase n=1 Tax=Paenibacillus sp. MBLB4367 TaxID=3384767 RepID=UPI0039081E81
MDNERLSGGSREIVRLKEEHRQQAVAMLPEAFANDPLFHYLFAGAPAGRKIQTRQFFSFLFDKSLILKESLIGATENGVLCGAASIELPTSTAGAGVLLNPLFLYRAMRLFGSIPIRSFTMLNRYMQLTVSVRPKVPHHYLVFLGVAPERQGKGLGSMLLHEIHEMADRDPSSAGIGLDTENPENVRLYERFGYRVVAGKRLGGIMVYGMFRPSRRGVVT